MYLEQLCVLCMFYSYMCESSYPQHRHKDIMVLSCVVTITVCFRLLRFAETLEQADDMAIDIPHIWLYLAELLSPVLREGGFSMRELFRY